MLRRPLLAILAVGMLVVCIPVHAQAQWWVQEQAQVSAVVSVKQTKEYRAVTNWEDGYVEVSAFGTADVKEAVNLPHAYAIAEKSARVRAYEKLAETIGGIQLTADTTLENELLKHSEVRTHMEAFIKGARVVDTKFELLDNGSPMVTVTVGRLLGLPHPGIDQPAPAVPEEPKTVIQVIRPLVEDAEMESPVLKWTPPAEVPPAPTEAPPEKVTQFDPDASYTGLILDARGLSGMPSMSPKILAPDGREVWGTMDVDPAFVISVGIAGWVHSMDGPRGARASSRSGSNPLIVKAVEVRGPAKCNFVVSERDAAIIRKANEKTGFLEKFCVLFIT